jgi:transposase
MKFKTQNKQNQRIEKITTTHLVVGIDVAKEVHYARAVNYRGIELGTPLSFKNDQIGFNQLFLWINKLLEKHGMRSILVGMEPTGHYWLSLAYWLLDREIEVVTVNPHIVKKNKENRDNSPTKNDAKDSLVIADTIKNGYYTELRIPTGNYAALRETMTARDFWVTQRVSVKNQIHRWLTIRFPEYYNVFRKVFGVSSLITLTYFPCPSDIVNLRIEDIIAVWKQHTKRHAGKAYAQALLDQAAKSIGSRHALSEAKQILSMLLQQYEQLSNQIEELERQATSLLELIPITQTLRTIPGIGDMVIAGLLAETGDPTGFVHGSQMLRLAGLHLGENSSGKSKGQTIITKRGRPRLRRILFLAVQTLVNGNPEFKELHRRNVKDKKMKKMKSILKLCGKLARIIVGLIRHHRPYHAETVYAQVA